MQGIATLDPRMNQPPAPMQGVENLSPEIANQANTVFGGMGPEQEAQFQQLAQELNQFLPEELQALLDVLEYLRQNKNRYQEAVQELIAQGRLTSGDVPEQYEPVFFSVMVNVIKQKMQQSNQSQPAGFAQGGLASLAQTMSNAGRNGDTMLAHITPSEMSYLNRVSGPPTINPVTGLPEYAFNNLGSFLKAAASVVIPIALSFTPLGPIAGAAVGSGLASLINGGKAADALKSALIGGAAGAVLSGISGSLSPDSAFRGLLPNVGSAAGQGFIEGVQAGLPSGLGLSGQYAMERNLPTWLGGSGEAAKTIVPEQVAEKTDIAKLYENDLKQQEYGTDRSAAARVSSVPQVSTLVANASPPGAPVSTVDSIKNFFNPSEPSTAQIVGSSDYKTLVSAGISPNEALKTVSAKMSPGLLASYGPMAAAGIGALALGGAFKTPETQREAIPESADFQGKTSQQLLAENPQKYQVANLNPYQFVQQNPQFMAQSNVVPSPNYTQTQTQRPAAAPIPNLLQYYYGNEAPMYAAKGGIAATDKYKRMTGHVAGSGTGTSDSIPARLSDGEFIMTAKAVRGAGDGDRISGAKKMYQLMRELEARG